MNRPKLNLRSWMLVALTGLVVAGAVGAQQEPSVVTVCPQLSEGCRYTNVQEAVNAAKPGDIVQIAPGTYETKDRNGAFISVMITKSMTLRGTGAKPENVVLRANKEVPVIRIEKAQNVTIENLTVREGSGGEGGTFFGTFIPPGILGGGLSIKESTAITIRNVISSDNSRYALYAENATDLLIEKSQFRRTERTPGNRGGAGLRFENSIAMLKEVVATDNLKWNGIDVYGSTVEIVGSTLRNNRYQGAYVDDLQERASVLTIHQTIIDGNLQYGLWVSGKTMLRMTESRIINTDPRGGQEVSGFGTGLYMDKQSQVQLDQVILDNNAGEGIVVRGQAQLTLTHSTISNTRYYILSDATHCNRGRLNSIGLCVLEEAQATVEQSTITGNANGLWVFQNGRLILRSSSVTKSVSAGIRVGTGQFRTESAYLEAVDNAIQENAANFGGQTGSRDETLCGIWIYPYTEKPEIKIVGSGNVGGQANGAPDACGAVQKIPPGFWK
jgi:hypothetical protein